MKTTKQVGTASYHYGAAKLSKGASQSNGARKPVHGKPAMGPSMGRKVMPGDAHAAMKRGC